MSATSGSVETGWPPLPLPATYWVVPGRLLAGEYPGSPSRAEAMERLRRVLTAGITCFVDLTEPGELPSYEALLPFSTPDGRRVEYLREPIRDHDVPASHDVVQRAVAMIDDALEAGHVAYLHCRAGIGRSATVVGCWLASRGEADPLARLQVLWRQSARSQGWPVVPETQAQAEFVRHWTQGIVRASRAGASPRADVDVGDRIRGALLGLAWGDACGEARRARRNVATTWTQHASLALCLAESLLETGVCDARDQMERYLRWQREGHLSASGEPGSATPDVARALATYQWRGLPMAGSHDPKDRTTSSLPRVVTAAGYALADPLTAMSLAVECARTTHQSPLVLDACRYYAALLLGALRGAGVQELLAGPYEPLPGAWRARPLKAEIVAAATGQGPASVARPRASAGDVVQAIATLRASLAASVDVASAIDAAVRADVEPALDAALAGALAGALHGARAIPPAAIAALRRHELLEQFASRLAGHQAARSGRGGDGA